LTKSRASFIHLPPAQLPECLLVSFQSASFLARIVYSFIVFHIPEHFLCACLWRILQSSKNFVCQVSVATEFSMMAHYPTRTTGKFLFLTLSYSFHVFTLSPFFLLYYFLILLFALLVVIVLSFFPSLATACWDFHKLKRNNALSACSCFISYFVNKTTKFHTQYIPFPFYFTVLTWFIYV
jgi:hypothetical protein